MRGLRLCAAIAAAHDPEVRGPRATVIFHVMKWHDGAIVSQAHDPKVRATVTFHATKRHAGAIASQAHVPEVAER